MRFNFPGFKNKKNTSNNRLSKVLVLSALMIFSLSGLALIYNEKTNPERVLWAALDNALHTRSIEAQFTAEGGQKAESYSSLQFSPNPIVQVLTKSYQSGDQQEPVAITHSIGTTQTDYLRFIKYQQQGLPSDKVKEIENVWTSKPAVGEESSKLLYNQYVYTFATNFPVLFADLNDSQRQQVIEVLRNEAVKVDYTKTKEFTDNGRRSYSYPVTLQVQGYVKALKAYGNAMGYTYFDKLDEAQFKDAPPLKIELIVDVLSQQVVGLRTEGLTIRYLAHGLVTRVNIIPEETITVEELQKRQESIQ